MKPHFSKLIDTAHKLIPLTQFSSQFIPHVMNESRVFKGLRYGVYELFNISRDSYLDPGLIELPSQITSLGPGLMNLPQSSNPDSLSVVKLSDTQGDIGYEISHTTGYTSLVLGKYNNQTKIENFSDSYPVIDTRTSSTSITIPSSSTYQYDVLGLYNQAETLSELCKHLLHWMMTLCNLQFTPENVDSDGNSYMTLYILNGNDIEIPSISQTLSDLSTTFQWYSYDNLIRLDNPNYIIQYVDNHWTLTGGSTALLDLGEVSSDTRYSTLQVNATTTPNPQYITPLPPKCRWAVNPKINTILSQYQINFKYVFSESGTTQLFTNWGLSHIIDSQGTIVGLSVILDTPSESIPAGDSRLILQIAHSEEPLLSIKVVTDDQPYVDGYSVVPLEHKLRLNFTIFSDDSGVGAYIGVNSTDV